MFWRTGECSLLLESCSRKALSVSRLVTVGAAVKPLHTVLIFSAARKNSAYSSRCGNMLDPGDSHTSLSPVDCRIWSALKFPSAMSVRRYTHLRNNLSNQDSEANHITHLFSSSFQLSGRFTPGCGQHGQNGASSAVRTSPMVLPSLSRVLFRPPHFSFFNHRQHRDKRRSSAYRSTTT